MPLRVWVGPDPAPGLQVDSPSRERQLWKWWGQWQLQMGVGHSESSQVRGHGQHAHTFTPGTCLDDQTPAGLVLCRSALGCRLWCQPSMGPRLLPANGPGTAVEGSPVEGLSAPGRALTGFLVSAWVTPGCCGHAGTEPANLRSLPVSPAPPVTLPFNQ